VPTFFDPHQLADPGPPRAANAVHAIPDSPFVLRGVLYDPKDIERFNDRDLHMIAGRPGDPLLAFDDRALMVNWWQLAYLSAVNAPMNTPKTLDAYGSGNIPTGGSVGITAYGPEIPSSSHPGGIGIGSDVILPHTNLWEHYNFQGSRLEVRTGDTLHRLSEYSSGFLGLGSDWNDRVSSVQILNMPGGVTLFEHKDYGGSSMHLTTSAGGLGWFNDLASSCTGF
jgi:hypothetical protein